MDTNKEQVLGKKMIENKRGEKKDRTPFGK